MMDKFKDFANTILNENYLFLELNLNKEHAYPYEKLASYSESAWTFKDAWGMQYVVQVRKGSIKKLLYPDDYYEIMFGTYWDGVVDYTIPETLDEKLFNTHMKIISDEIVGKKSSILVYRFAPVDDDPRRKRLFQIAMNKYLDKNMWEILDNNKDPIKNSIWIKRKK